MMRMSNPLVIIHHTSVYLRNDYVEKYNVITQMYVNLSN